jgi:lipopolysaccharide transport system permease protein
MSGAVRAVDRAGGSAESTPVVHVRRNARWRGLGLADIWAYRGLMLTLGLRDIKLRQKQTLLGIGWVVLQPLLSAGVLTVVFGLVVAVPTPGGLPFFVFAYLGQMGWSLFSVSLSRTSGSLRGNVALVMKIYFPRPILPFAGVVAGLVDFSIAFTLAIPMIAAYSTGIHIPVAVLAGISMVLLATGIGFMFSSLSVKYRDVLYGLPFVVQLGMYASPVAYSLALARENLEARSPLYFALYMLNPITSLVESFRWALLGEGLFLPGYLAYAVAVSVLVFVAGFLVFRSQEGRFADVI